MSGAAATEVADRIVWALARQCRSGDVVVVGIATPIAAAAALLARAVLVDDLTVIVAASVDPPPHDVAMPLLQSDFAAKLAVGAYAQTEVLDAIQRGDITLQFVSPAQVDGTGALNTSRVRAADGSLRRLPGGVATADVAVLVGRLVAYRAGHSPRFLAPQVDFTTGAGHAAGPAWRQERALPGTGLQAVVTDQATLTWDSAAGAFRLAELLGEQDAATVQAGCGFPLLTDAEVPRAADLPPEARRALDDVVDPHGIRRLEVRAGRDAAVAALEALRS